MDFSQSSHFSLLLNWREIPIYRVENRNFGIISNKDMVDDSPLKVPLKLKQEKENQKFFHKWKQLRNEVKHSLLHGQIWSFIFRLFLYKLWFSLDSDWEIKFCHLFAGWHLLGHLNQCRERHFHSPADSYMYNVRVWFFYRRKVSLTC